MRKSSRIDNSPGQLLVKITRHKLLKHKRAAFTASRSPDREEHLEDWTILGSEPTPEQAALVADLIDGILERVEPIYGEVLRLWLVGYTEEQTAQELGLHRTSVRRKRQRLRERLERLLGADGAPRSDNAPRRRRTVRWKKTGLLSRDS